MSESTRFQPPFPPTTPSPATSASTMPWLTYSPGRMRRVTTSPFSAAQSASPSVSRERI